MKILLINNNTVHLNNLHCSLVGHQVELQEYRPGLDFHYEDKDLVILSGGGGEGNEIYDTDHPGHLWYEDQMDFILKCDKPLIGICMGFEVICSTFGVKVEEMPRLFTDDPKIKTTKKGKIHLGQDSLKQYEAHKWRVTSLPKGFEALADSETGIEIIRSVKGNKSMFATQFHPEVASGTLRLSQLITT